MDERLRRRLVGGLVLLAGLWLLAFLIPNPPAPGERSEEQVVIDLRSPEASMARAATPATELPAPPVTPAPEPQDARAQPPPRQTTASPTSTPRPTLIATPTPRPAPPTAPPLDTAPAGTTWWVQVGAYSAREAAEQVRETLRVADLPAVVQSASVEGRPVHRVRIGPFPAAAQAESAQARAVLLGHAQATVFRQ